MLLPWKANRTLLCSLLALSACGGGGGSGPGGAAPPSGQAANPATLELLERNYSLPPSRIVAASEMVLAAAQFGADLAQRFAAKGAPLTQTTSCSTAGGQLSVALSDLDGNGFASAGDRISAQMKTCKVGLFNDVVTGNVTVELQQTTSLADGKFVALVRLEDVSLYQKSLSGSFNVDMTRSAVAQSWRVTGSSANDLKFVLANEPASYLRTPLLSKTVDYAAARNEVTLAMSYETSAGTALVSTPAKLASYLGRVADQGSFEIQGSNGKVRVTTARGQFGTTATIDLLIGTASAPVASNSAPLDSMTSGFLWWDGQLRDSYTLQPLYDPQDYIAYTFYYHLIVPDTGLTSPEAVFRLQFTRPPAQFPQLHYRFYDNSESYPPPALPVIPAQVEVHGALLLIRPSMALNHGRSYLVQASTDGVTWTEPGRLAPDITFTDTEGHEAKLYNGGIATFRTPNTLLASIEGDQPLQIMTAGDMLTLNSAVSAAAGRTIVRYSWTQVSGTPLKLGSADGTAAMVAWGTVKPTGIETAVIQLQVTDSTGDTDVARMAVMVGDSATAAQFLRLKREGGLGYRRPGPAYFYEPPGDQFYKTLYEPGRYTFREVLLGGNAAAHLVLVTPGAAPLAVGHYEQAGAIGLYNIFENPCAIHGGSYDVREVATAADGTFSRLAVDFTHICDGGIPVYGSYRRNSSVPLPD